MNWIQRKIYLYNVTFGLYMLDWWERYLFNILIVVLLWFILYNSSKYVTDFCKRMFKNVSKCSLWNAFFETDGWPDNCAACLYFLNSINQEITRFAYHDKVFMRSPIYS